MQTLGTRRSSGNLPDAVFCFLVLNGLAFAALLWQPGWLLYHLALWTPGTVNPPFQFWQLLSYGFLHSPTNYTHILFNMLALWMFGKDIENAFGTRRFVAYYLLCIIGAGLTQIVAAKVSGSAYPTVGASGGVFGLLLAFGVLYPNRTIMLIFPPIPMKAKYFVVLFGLMELYLGFSGSAPNVAHFAHLGGMLMGIVLLVHWRVIRFKR